MKLRECVLLGAVLMLGGRFSQAQVIVYDNLAPSTWTDAYPADPNVPQGDEFGDEVDLQPYAAQTLQSFTFQYLAKNFTGNERVELKLYQNDGPVTTDGFPTPGTVLYDSGPLQVNPDPQGRGTITLNNLNVQATPTLMWTVQFTGIDGTKTAGLAITGDATVGASYDDFWEKVNGVWGLYRLSTDGTFISNFGAQITAVPEPTETGCVLLVTAALVILGTRMHRRFGMTK
jgi:hypothetical protein